MPAPYIINKDNKSLLKNRDVFNKESETGKKEAALRCAVTDKHFLLNSESGSPPRFSSHVNSKFLVIILSLFLSYCEKTTKPNFFFFFKVNLGKNLYRLFGH